MSENEEKINSNIVLIVGIVCISSIIAFMYIHAYILGGVSFEHQVDPELMTGLLTASSIIFGFSSFLVTDLIKTHEHEKIASLVLIFPFATMILSGAAIYDVALGRLNAVEAMLRLFTNFIINIVSTSFIIGFRLTGIQSKRKRRKKQ